MIRNEKIVKLIEDKGGLETDKGNQEIKDTPPTEAELLAKAKERVAEGYDLNAPEDKGTTLLHFASIFGYKDLAIYLFQQGADPNVSTEIGFTALHAAVVYSRLDFVKFLLKKGVEVNSKSGNEGLTPLHFSIVAQQEPNTDIIIALLEAGADINARNNRGETPLQLAIETKQDKIADLLRQYGAKE